MYNWDNKIQCGNKPDICVSQNEPLYLGLSNKTMVHTGISLVVWHTYLQIKTNLSNQVTAVINRNYDIYCEMQ